MKKFWKKCSHTLVCSAICTKIILGNLLEGETKRKNLGNSSHQFLSKCGHKIFATDIQGDKVTNTHTKFSKIVKLFADYSKKRKLIKKRKSKFFLDSITFLYVTIFGVRVAQSRRNSLKLLSDVAQ